MGHVFRCWQHRQAGFLHAEGSVTAQAGVRGILLSSLVLAQGADIALYCPTFLNALETMIGYHENCTLVSHR